MHERTASPGPRAGWTHRALLVLVALGVLARTYHIDAPLLDHRVFRQQDTAALARNFHEGRLNIFFPQVDWRGTSTGYAEAEFQAYNFTVALLYGVFGAHEWVGRALNVLLYALSALLLFRFARRLFDERAALLAVFFYTVVPLSFFFNRAFLGDTLVSLASLAGVAFFLAWTEERRGWQLALSAAGVALAALIKPASLYLGLPLVYLCHRAFGWSFLRRPLLWAYAAATILPAAAWYAYAVRYWEVDGNTFGVIGTHAVIGFWGPTDARWLQLLGNLAERLVLLIATPLGLPLLVLGLVAERARRNHVLLWWLAGFAVYVLLIPRGHRGHDYYQLPAVFPLAIWMGAGAAMLVDRRWLPRPALAAVLAGVVVLSGWQIAGLLEIKETWRQRQAFGQRVQELTEEDALFVYVVPMPVEDPPLDIYRHRTPEGEQLYCDPVDFYLSHRKGWSLDEALATPERVEALRQRGAAYLGTFFPAVLERQPELKRLLDERHTLVGSEGRWSLYRLEDPGAPPARPSSG
jgi:hypothetical protein